MFARHTVAIRGVWLSAALVGGCAAPLKQPAAVFAPAADVVLPTTEPTPAPSNLNTDDLAEMAARKAADERLKTYSTKLETLLAERVKREEMASQALPTPTPTPVPTPAPTPVGPQAVAPKSDVQWPDNASARVVAPRPAPTNVEPESSTSTNRNPSLIPGDTAGDAMALAGPAKSNVPLALDGEGATAMQMLRVKSRQPVVQTASLNAAGLRERLEKSLHDDPTDLANQLDYQILLHLLDEPTPSVQSLTPLVTGDRELVSAVSDALENFRNTVRADSNQLLSRKIKPFIDLADRLRTQAELNVGTVSLCRAVRTFGDYDPMATQFSANKSNPTILYCEIQNFASKVSDKHLWETKLTQEVVLYSETGQEVWKDEVRQFNDAARTKRNDFFVAKKVTLPVLPIGKYVLKVTLSDQLTNRMCDANVPITVVAE